MLSTVSSILRFWPRELMSGATGKKEGKTRLLNIVMQLRKCCNHPYCELSGAFWAVTS